MTAERFDAMIIGTGQSGKPLAGALGAAGWKTAVVERQYVGGTCINVGCTPTKTMVASARVAYLARRAAEYGVQGCEAIRVDMAAVRARKQRVVEQFRESGERYLRGAPNVDLVFGEASFVDRRTVRVALSAGGERLLTAPKVVINTGGRPAVPPIPGLGEVRALDSSSIMELGTVPEHLVVLGGGYIGLEFSQMFRRYGVARIDGGSDVQLQLDVPGGPRRVVGTHLLVAVGRVPNTERLNLPAADIAIDKSGYIPTNGKLETAVPGIYAIGDVKGGPAFTHISYDDYRVLRANLLEGGAATIDGRYVPNTMFIDPQLATIGLNETEAKRRGIDYRLAKLPMTSVARAIELGETRGFMKALVDPGSRQILGCTVLGIEGGELMAMIEIAMLGKFPYPALKEAIFAHPTLAESLNNLFASL